MECSLLSNQFSARVMWISHPIRYVLVAELLFMPLPETGASAPSRLHFRVETLQFAPRFVDGELPIDGSLLLVDTG